MKYKNFYFTIAIILIICVASAILLSKNFSLPEGEKKVTLEGEFIIIEDKYPILAFETSEETYWTYEYVGDFESYLNKTVTIDAILSPLSNSICTRECANCQCPNRDLLYNIKVK